MKNILEKCAGFFDDLDNNLLDLDVMIGVDSIDESSFKKKNNKYIVSKSDNPEWVSNIDVEETHDAWKITVESNTFNCKTVSKNKSFYITKDLTFNEAVQKALAGSKSLYIHARGCWIVTKVKEKYGEDQDARRELFGSYCKLMKAKYDGVHYLYESQEAQDEMVMTLKVPELKR